MEKEKEAIINTETTEMMLKEEPRQQELLPNKEATNPSLLQLQDNPDQDPTRVLQLLLYT